jgi:CDP-diacylglycerol pyrophosphatase
MAGKKRPKNAEDKDIGGIYLPPVPTDPRAIEKTIFDLGRVINQHDFASEKELNDFLQSLLMPGERLASPEPQTPLEEAQAVMYEAWGATSPSKRIKLAKKALAISEDCADAYVLLAEESAKTMEQAIHFYQLCP